MWRQSTAQTPPTQVPSAQSVSHPHAPPEVTVPATEVTQWMHAPE
jgi:hypothetical protein